jgi:hypothetical protein
VDGPADHPWHHGLWFAIKYVDGENFWEEYDAYGVVRHEAAPTSGVDGSGAWLAGSLRWVRPDRTTVVLHEDRVLRHVPLGPGVYAIDWLVRLRPVDDVVLDRTPFTTWGGYGGLTLRGRPDWHDTELLVPGGGVARLLGDAAPWCDLGGPVADTGRDAGVLVLDHPSNPAHPTPWYASTRADTYGEDGWSNFVNAAFLWHGPRTVAAGDVLEIRHRVVVHDGRWDADRCMAAWERWVSEPVLAWPPHGRDGAR